ncbi:hypothetical protein CFOL_v3_15895, partial [Cephalotus follicularis]
FMMTFHMNKIEMTLTELVSMLRTTKANFDIGKSKSLALLLPSSRAVQGKGSASSSLKGKDGPGPVNTKGMFMIKLNLTLNISSTWILDIGCETNHCNSLQGLRKVRQLGAGDLDLRLGDGFRIIAMAVGIFDITWSNGCILTLYPCYYVP